MSLNRRVVITGLGAITPIGCTVEEYWENLCAGKSGGGVVTHLDTTEIPSKIAAMVSNFDPLDYFDRKDARKNERFTQFAVIAARQAIRDSGLEVTDENRTRIGAMIGCGIGGLDTIEEQHSNLLQKGPRRVSPFLIPKIITNMAAGLVAI
ncbi:beta-ketoacyl-[acyl-carrier-protein] synthase II, partial [bacterium]|nr:beta-ketoacyl-[acyl-carrier-protein] synthase II [bacterium]